LKDMCLFARNAETDKSIQAFAAGVARHYASISRTPSSVVHLKVSGVRPLQTRWCNVCEKLTGWVNGLCQSCNDRLAKEYKDKQEPQAAPGVKCSSCGDEGDVVMRWIYRGGNGYQWTPDCRSKPDCWKRQDEAMGLEHKPLVVAIPGE